MPVLPYQTFVIESPLPPREASARLDRAVEPKRLLRFGPAACPFEGRADGDGFDIQRVIGYQNSFVPRIRGTLEPAATGSCIRASMSLHPLVIAFMTVWFSGVILIGLPIALLGIAGPAPAPFHLIPVAMLVFGWALMAGAFTYEARRAIRELAALFAAPAVDVASAAR